MVVSEIGEQWSPQTAPARQADIQTVPKALDTGNIASTIGIRIPKVPQLVPVANERKQATRNTRAGKSFCNEPAPSTKLATNTSAPKMPVTFLREVANVKIKIAGSIALKPSGILSIHSLIVKICLTK